MSKTVGLNPRTMWTEKLTDFCGCVWENREGIWVRVKSCPKDSALKQNADARRKERKRNAEINS